MKKEAMMKKLNPCIIFFIVAIVSLVGLGEVLAQTTERVSVASNGDEGNNGSSEPSISTDGRYVSFSSDASNLVDTTSFLMNTLTGTQNPPQVFPKYILAISLAIPITYFLDVIRVHAMDIEPLVPYAVEVGVFLGASFIFPVLGIWFFRYTDRRCRIKGNLHVH